MKECPVCNARCFDDMGACYGCLHEFGEADSEQTFCDDQFEEYEEAPLSLMPKGASNESKSAVFRLEVPPTLKSFTIRCEGFQIDGVLA